MATEPKKLADMTPQEIASLITENEKKHRESQTYLWAFLRCLPGGPELLAKKASK